MACNNALLIRYIVKIAKGSCDNTPGIDAVISNNTNNGVVQSVTRVSGLDLGEEGTIEVPDWDIKYTVSDGKRVIPPLGIQYRIDADLKTFNLMTFLFQNRATVSIDWEIIITNRSWQKLYSYKAIDSQIRRHGQEDQELGTSKIGLIDTIWAPSDMQLIDANGNKIVYKIAIPPLP